MLAKARMEGMVSEELLRRALIVGRVLLCVIVGSRHAPPWMKLENGHDISGTYFPKCSSEARERSSVLIVGATSLSAGAPLIYLGREDGSLDEHYPVAVWIFGSFGKGPNSHPLKLIFGSVSQEREIELIGHGYLAMVDGLLDCVCGEGGG
jgi:hypothetical protein